MITKGFPALRRIQISNVRGWSAREFRKMTEPILVEYHSTPVAVVVSYAMWLEMQKALEAARELEAAGDTAGGIHVRAVPV